MHWELGLTLGVAGAQDWWGHPEGGAGAVALGMSMMGIAVAYGRMGREKDQKGRSEEDEQVGNNQCPQDVLAALLTTGPNTGRVPAAGGGGRR